MGADSINSYPTYITGSEVYELSNALRQEAMSFARTVELVDSARAKEYRTRFANSPNDEYDAAALGPVMLEGEGRVFESLLAREATGGRHGTCDEIIHDCQSGICYDGSGGHSHIDCFVAGGTSEPSRQPPSDGLPSLPLDMDASGGLEPALENLYRTGVEIVQGIVQECSGRFEDGLEDDKYVGDIFASLGGDADFLAQDI